MTKEFVIVDIDGTVSNTDHREEHAQAGNWDAFHSLGHLDPPYADVVAVIIALSAGRTLISITGRNERYRTQTVEWLRKQQLPIEELLMRPNDDYSKSVDMKIRMLEARFGSKEAVLANVLCVFDDHEGIVAGLRDYGLTVFQPRFGTY